MPTTETLTAILESQGDLASDLKDVAEGFGGVASAAGASVRPIERSSEALENVGQEASKTSRDLQGVAASSAVASSALAALDGQDVDIDMDDFDVDEGFFSLDQDTLDSIEKINTEDIQKRVNVDVQKHGSSYVSAHDRKVNVDVDVDRTELYALGSHIDALNRRNIDLDTNVDRDQLYRTKSYLSNLNDNYDIDFSDSEIEVSTSGVAEAIADLTELKTVGDKLDGRTINIDAKVDQDRLNVGNATQKISRSVDNLPPIDPDFDQDFTEALEMESVEAAMGEFSKDVDFDINTSPVKEIEPLIDAATQDRDVDIGYDSHNKEITSDYIPENPPLPDFDRYEARNLAPSSRSSSYFDSFMRGVNPPDFSDDDLAAMADWGEKLPQDFRIGESGIAGGIQESIDDIEEFNRKINRSGENVEDFIDRIPRDMSLGKFNRLIDEDQLDIEDLDLNEESRKIYYEAAIDSSSLDQFREKLNSLAYNADRIEGKASEIDFNIREGDNIADLRSQFLQFGENLEDVNGKIKKTRKGMGLLDDSGISTRLNLGPLNVGLGNALVAIPSLIGLVGALASAIGGLAVAAAGFVGIFGLIAGGGLMSIASGMVGTSEDIENKWDAIQKIMENFKNAIADALAPLQNAQNAEFILDIMNGVIETVGDAAEFASRMTEQFMAATDVLGNSYWNMEPQFFAAMEGAMQDLMPILVSFLTWFMDVLPDAIAWFADEGKQLLPVLGAIGVAVLNLLKEVSELGTTILSTLGPGVAILINLLAQVIGLINAIPGPLQEMIIMFAALGFAVASMGAIASGIAMIGKSIIGLLGTAVYGGKVILSLGRAIKTLQGFLFLANLKGFAGALSLVMVRAGGTIAALGGLISRLGMVYAFVGGGGVIAGLKAVGLHLLFVGKSALASALGINTATLSLGTYTAAISGAIASSWAFITTTLATAAAQGTLAGALGVLTGAAISAAGAMGTFWSVSTLGLAPLIGLIASLAYLALRFVDLELAIWAINYAIDAMADGLRQVILWWYEFRQAIPGGKDFSAKITRIKKARANDPEMPEIEDRGAALGIGDALMPGGGNKGPVGKPSAREAYGGTTVNQTFHGDAVGGNDIQTRTEQAVEAALANERNTQTPMSDE